MSSSFRILTLSGFLLVTALGFSSAHAAIFVNKDLGKNASRGGRLPFRAPPALIRCMIGKLVKYGASERPILPSSVLTLEEPERRTERPSNYSPATGPAHRGGSTRFLARSSIRQAASASTSKRTSPASRRW